VFFLFSIGRQWPKLQVYFDESNKWIFFVGTPSNDQPLTFVLPISSDEQLTVDDLFNLKSKLCSSLSSNIGENIQRLERKKRKKNSDPSYHLGIRFQNVHHQRIYN
jgi:hypothetical protein